jgi:hypothetical protein
MTGAPAPDGADRPGAAAPAPGRLYPRAPDDEDQTERWIAETLADAPDIPDAVAARIARALMPDRAPAGRPTPERRRRPRPEPPGPRAAATARTTADTPPRRAAAPSATCGSATCGSARRPGPGSGRTGGSPAAGPD